jgi:hypothetical protein
MRPPVTDDWPILLLELVFVVMGVLGTLFTWLRYWERRRREDEQFEELQKRIEYSKEWLKEQEIYRS